MIDEKQRKMIEEYAQIVAKNLVLYGVDIRDKYDSAVSMSLALENAYLRGRSDGLKYAYEGTKKIGEWIPCSERLPENEKLLYWTTHEDGTVMIHGWLKTNGFIYNWEVDDLEKRKRMGQVVAWMPIFEPEPYKE